MTRPLLLSRATLPTMAIEDNELLSVRETGDRLGFSVEHVKRLIETGELTTRQPSGGVSVQSILAFERRYCGAERRADEFSCALDRAGAPAE